MPVWNLRIYLVFEVAMYIVYALFMVVMREKGKIFPYCTLLAF